MGCVFFLSDSNEVDSCGHRPHTARLHSRARSFRCCSKGSIGASAWCANSRHNAEDGSIEIDNNPVERQLRAVALGRKNFLFAGSDAGGERAAAFYSLIGTAKLCGLDPEAYLREVFTRIAEHPVNRIEELLPWRLASALADTRLAA